MDKYYTYNIRLLTGYKYVLEKNYIKSFSNTEGFTIIYVDSNKINFKISSQLIRKLKLYKLSNQISPNSIEYKLSRLLELSKEKEEFNINKTTWYSSVWSSTSGTHGCEVDEVSYEEKKEQNKYFTKLQNQKFKQYSK